MKFLAFMIVSISLVSCGKKKSNSSSGSETLTENLVSNCTVERDEELAQVRISCPDGSEEIISDGKDGRDGVDGEDGTSCSIQDVTGGAMITCGETQAFIKDGVDGADGSACSVAQDENGSGALVSCADGTSAFIRNGQDGVDGEDGQDGADGEDGQDGQDGADGEDGQDGQDGADGEDGQDGQDGLDFVAEIIDPCGQQTTHGLDEVLLRLHSGEILAHFAQGDKQYLTILEKNKNYITTDGTGCKFKIDNEGNILD